MAWHFSNRLIQDYGNSLCSQVQVAESSEERCWDGEPSAPWKSTPSAPDDSCSAKMKDIFHRSPFGMMYAPSTDALGEDLLMWFQEDSRARTSAMLEAEMALLDRAVDFGATWRESFATYDLHSSSWKIRQLSLFADFGESLETFPKWGIMQDGECWELTTPGRLTCGTESGFWPTPTVCGNHNRKGAGDGLSTRVKKVMWATPCATDTANRQPSPSPHTTKNGTIRHIGKSGKQSQIRLSQDVKHRE